jgi:hypothetical protein
LKLLAENGQNNRLKCFIKCWKGTQLTLLQWAKIKCLKESDAKNSYETSSEKKIKKTNH